MIWRTKKQHAAYREQNITAALRVQTACWWSSQLKHDEGVISSLSRLEKKACWRTDFIILLSNLTLVDSVISVFSEVKVEHIVSLTSFFWIRLNFCVTENFYSQVGSDLNCFTPEHCGELKGFRAYLIVLTCLRLNLGTIEPKTWGGGHHMQLRQSDVLISEKLWSL